MNYDWLFSFATFAETCNFTKAAALLHISQPALHVQIRKLTESIGTPLYVRQGRHLLLTSEGKQVAAYARSVSQQEKELRSQLLGAGGGPVILASGQGAFMYLLGEAVQRFSKGKQALRLWTLKGPQTVEAVQTAKAHLGVAVLANAPAHLSITPIREVMQVAVVHKSHVLSEKRHLKLRDLTPHPLIVAPEGSPHRARLQYAMSQAGARLNVAVEATGWPIMLDFAKHKRGVAIVNDFCHPPHGCVALQLREMPKTTYSLLHRNTLSPSAAALRDLIVKYTKKPAIR